jgi:hypothetical protein
MFVRVKKIGAYEYLYQEHLCRRACLARSFSRRSR